MNSCWSRGEMTGPTKQGMARLLYQDPYAHWDSATQSIQGSLFPDPMASPRVAIVAFFDPRQPPTSGRNSLFVHQMGAVFIEGVNCCGKSERPLHPGRGPVPGTHG